MPSMAVCNIAVALITAIVGGVISYTAYGYGIEMSMFGPGAGFWPFILGLGLIAIALLIVIDTIRCRGEFSQQKVVFNSQGCFGAYRMMAVVLVYAALFPLLGFYVSSFLFLFVGMLMLGVNNKLLALGVSAGFLAVIYLLFTLALHIQLPVPFFME